MKLICLLLGHKPVTEYEGSWVINKCQRCGKKQYVYFKYTLPENSVASNLVKARNQLIHRKKLKHGC